MKKKMNIREMNKHPEQIPHTVPLHLDEVELIFLYRVLNEEGKQHMRLAALDFAKVSMMRNKCVRGI